MMEKVNSVCISVVCEAGRRIVDWVGKMMWVFGIFVI